MNKKFSVSRLLLIPITWIRQALSVLGKHVNADISNSHYYTKDHKDVMYCSMGNWLELGKTPMEVDISSFEVLNERIAKDKNKAYYLQYPIKDVKINLATFNASVDKWMWHIGMDKDNVYYFGSPNHKSVESIMIEGADSNSYKRINGAWGKDSHHYFYHRKQLEVDYTSFEIIDFQYAKDKLHVYFEGEIIAEADPSSFKGNAQIGHHDKNAQYVDGKRVE